MQVFRLVDPGHVDKMIAFDELPKRFLRNIRTKNIDGFPKYWKTWLAENGASRQVTRIIDNEGNTETITEHYTYILDYKDVNNDKEAWQAITNYVRKAVDLSVRLMDKMEDMARPLAIDSKSELSLDTDDVPVIPVPHEFIKKEEPPIIIKPAVGAPVELEATAEPKRRGRPKKVSVEA